MRESFQRVITEAVNDLLEHGYDSKERVDQWLERIRRAATASLIPEATLIEQLRSTLRRVFSRSTEPARLLRFHRGVSAYTLEQVKPRLRAELDRRILAAADLIRLNREASKQRTLQRFAGWATSIPIGGTEAAKHQEVKQNIKRSIAGLPFEERRVIIDQGLKLSSAINEIVAVDGGAIAGIWRHVKEGGGYQARPEHVARDGKIFVVRDNWALREGFIKLAGHQYIDEIERPAELIYCRCWYEMLYALRDLPEEMLTEEGREALVKIRAAISGKSAIAA